MYIYAHPPNTHHIYIYVHPLYTHTHMYMHTYAQNTHPLYAHTHVYIYIYKYAYPLILCASLTAAIFYVCRQRLMCIQTHAHTHAHTCTHMYTHTRTHMHTYTCTLTHTLAHTCTGKNKGVAVSAPQKPQACLHSGAGCSTSEGERVSGRHVPLGLPPPLADLVSG